MPYFGRDGVVSATEVIEISGGYHVTIGLLSGKQAAECEAILQTGQKQKSKVVSHIRAGSSQQDSEQTMELTLDYQTYRDARLLRGIKAWDLDDDDGQVVPIDMAHIQLMPEKDRNTVFIALDKFNKPLTEDERGNSSTPPTSSSRPEAAI